MAACYYLDCSCGKRMTVEPRQAGSQIKCDCGATLEVPTLRGLQALPRAEDRPEEAAAIWTVRQAIATVSVVVALIFFGLGLWMWLQERELQQHRLSLDFNPQKVAEVDERFEGIMEQSTPLNAWRLWVYIIEPELRNGIGEQNAFQKAYLESMIQQKQIERWAWWGAAAAVLACTFLWAKFAPQSREHSTP